MRTSKRVKRLAVAGVLLALVCTIYAATRRFENHMVTVINAPYMHTDAGYVWSSPSEITYIRYDPNGNCDLVGVEISSNRVLNSNSFKGVIAKSIENLNWVNISPSAQYLLVTAPEKEPRYRVFSAGDARHGLPVAASGHTLDLKWDNNSGRWLKLEQDDQGRHLDWCADDKLVRRIKVPDSCRAIIGAYEGDVVKLQNDDLTRNRKAYDITTVHLNDPAGGISTEPVSAPEPCDWWTMYGVPPYHKLIHQTVSEAHTYSFRLKDGWKPEFFGEPTLITNVWVTDLDGKNPKQLLHFEMKDGVYGPHDYAIMPGGKQLSFWYDKKIYKVNID